MRIKATRQDAYNLFHRGILAFAHAERNGMRIDVDYYNKQKQILSKRISNLERKIKNSKFYKDWAKQVPNPDWNSNQQLGHYLYDICGYTPAKLTEKGQGATDEEALLQLDIPEIQYMLKIRKMKKIRDTYIEGFLREQVDGFLHPTFNLHTVTTFRSSSTKPNFQNIPKRDKLAKTIIRNGIFARKGHLVLEADYSGVEVRIAACYHKDPTMISYIKDTTKDMHGDMAAQLFIIDNFNRKIPEYKYLRQASKNGFVFPEFYGSWWKSCAKNLACNWGKLPEQGEWKSTDGVSLPGGITLGQHFRKNKIRNLEDFEKHVEKIEKDFWERRFKVYNQWKKRHYNNFLKNGYVDLFTGFRCYAPMSKNEVINTPVQGAAFHCLLLSFILLTEKAQKEKWDSRIIGQIHDAIIMDVHPEELDMVAKAVKQVMTVEVPRMWKWINIPLEIEIEVTDPDAPWSKIKEYKI